jgi:hypothetical protein
MPPKKAQPVVSTSGFLYCMYSGLLKQTAARVGSTSTDPTVDELPQFKEYYGAQVKGRYVKSKNVQADFAALKTKLEDKLYSGSLYHDINISELVLFMKEVTGSKTCSTYNVQAEKPEEEEASAEAEAKEAGADENADLEEEIAIADPKPKTKPPTKKAPVKKPTVKEEIIEEEEAVEEEEADAEAVEEEEEAAADDEAEEAAEEVIVAPKKINKAATKPVVKAKVIAVAPKTVAAKPATKAATTKPAAKTGVAKAGKKA